MELEAFSAGWCGLDWTPWCSLAPGQLSLVDRAPGLYRVRVLGQPQLAYVGQTGRDLRERLGALALHTHRDQPPWNDPHTGAPGLWAWRVEAGYGYEASVAYLTLPSPQRQCVEDLLLYEYRQEVGQSTLCNHGRFHPRWSRPSNRKGARSMVRLPAESPNPAGGDSLPPPEVIGQPSDREWMGLAWSESGVLSSVARASGQVPGVYRLLIGEEVVYIGQSRKIGARLTSHGARLRSHDVLASYVPMPGGLSHHLLEREADLIGACYKHTGRPPAFQYAPRG